MAPLLIDLSTLAANKSLVIGLTLVVAGDSYLITLFIVILFHQMFEGIALGSRIASIGTGPGSLKRSSEESGTYTPPDTKSAGVQTSTPTANVPQLLSPEKAVSTRGKMIMALAFSLVTPIGMAIGIGVLHKFNGNDPSTLVALGTLDAFSAGILVWVGIGKLPVCHAAKHDRDTDREQLRCGLGIGCMTESS